MSAGLMLFVVGLAACVVGVVLALFVVQRLRKRRRAAAAGFLIGAMACGVIGYGGIYGAFRMPYLQLMPVCAANLRGIAMALELYEKEHGCRPTRLRELVDAELATPKQFSCPLAWMDGQSWDSDTARPDFSYVPDVNSGDPAHWIVAFDNGNHHGDGTRTVVFRDGSTRVMRSAEFETNIKQFVAEFTAMRKREPRIVE
jgi:hypothetical protein